MHNRYTIQELKEISNKKLIDEILAERQSDCTNYYSPLYKRLTALRTWVEKNVPEDKR